MFIDANIFVHASVDKGKCGERARGFIKRIEKGEQVSATSVLVLDEVFWVVKDIKSEDYALSVWSRIMRISNLRFLEITKGVGEKAPEFIKLGLSSRDAIHLATMKEHGFDTILTYDKHFDKVKIINRQEP